MVGWGVRWLHRLFEGSTGGCDEGWCVGRGNGGGTGFGLFCISGCFDIFYVFVAVFFCQKIRLLVDVISINPAVFIASNLGRSEEVLFVIINTLVIFLWFDSDGFLTLENISLSLTNVWRVWVLVGGSNLFHCDWRRDEVISFAVARRVSVANMISIGILWGNQSTIMAMQVEFVVGVHIL